MEDPNKYFGTDEQQVLERRADLLWQIVGGDPGYSCHGRAVAVNNRGVEDIGLQTTLAKLQGAVRLTREVMEARATILQGAGLVTDVYEH